MMLLGRTEDNEGEKSLPWSVYFQNPEFLERTRMFLIDEDMIPLVRTWCGVSDGMKLLDVGCGSGYFTRLLAEGPEDVCAVGIDMEAPHIAYAQKLAEERNLSIDFRVGDALLLPFEDASFDLVASHTFLTCVSDADRAMAEMVRVVKPGGTVVSVTPLSFFPSAISLGEYPEDCTWVKEFQIINSKMTVAYFSVDPLSKRALGVKPSLVPNLFVTHGLQDVSAYPLGKLFSLSNAAIAPQKKLQWIDLYESSERKKAEAFDQLPNARKYVTEDEVQHFIELLHEKCMWLRDHVGENAIWDWQAGANVLVTGTRPLIY